MRKFLGAAAVLAVVSAPVLAQTTTTPVSPPTMTSPAVTIPVTPIVPGAPVAGANSFTESQARARIEAKGFGNVTGLVKDDQSVWRGQAMKDGKTVAVALDYQGNIVAN